MMNRESKVMLAIEKAEAEGYKLLTSSDGKYDEKLAEYRGQGYDVRCWYLSKSGEESTWKWIMYGRLKGQRRAAQPKVVTPDFSKLTVKELKKLCSEKKIAGYSKMNKEQMIESLLQAV